MKNIHSDISAARRARAGVSAHGLIWITVRGRADGIPHGFGFWTGDDHQNIAVASSVRTYYGAGAALDLGDSMAEIGIAVRTRQVTLSGLSPEVQDMVKAYETRLAPVEIHRIEFDTLTGGRIAPSAEPERVFKGWIDSISWQQTAETVNCTLGLASVARALTRPLPGKYSDASQRLVNSADAFFKYVDVSGSVDVYWGEKRVVATPSAASSVPRNKGRPQ